MRTVALRALAAGVAILIVQPAFAQGPPRGRGFGGGMQDPKTIILQAPVQDELKLDDSQKGDLQKIKQKFDSARQEARQTGATDREKAQEMIKTAGDEAKKEIAKATETLKPEQTKRLHQLEIQFAGIRAFENADVQKELKLNDKQKGDIKEITDGLAKDSQELFQSARGDQTKRQETMQKIAALNKEGFEKVTGVLTEDQKTTWKEMVGEKFDKFERGMPGGRQGRPGARPAPPPKQE
jgi:Spy/CpxP family protein refolding chaperone